jgi:hypothetical protein
MALIDGSAFADVLLLSFVIMVQSLERRKAKAIFSLQDRGQA